MTAIAPTPGRAFSIKRLRSLSLVVLVGGLTLYTLVMFTLVQHLSERFGPQVRADLEWRALRGAEALAVTTDVGLVVSDPTIVTDAFGAYATAGDVQAIVALDATGKVVAQHGTAPEIARLFAGPPRVATPGPGYLVSWAPAVIEGTTVGKVAVVVSTQRLIDGEALLVSVERTTVIAGALGLLLGVLVILVFTRAVGLRDSQLHDYAHNLEAKVEARTAELDARNRGMQLVLDSVAQGFITIDLDGTMAAERSAIVERWFGAVPPGTRFGELIRAHDDGYALWFGLGLDSLRGDFLPLALCLDQMPPRFTVGDRTFQVSYSPIGDAEPVRELLLVVSDVTTQVAREREQREQRELVAMFQRITSDRGGFEEFLTEASSLVDTLAAPTDLVTEKRAVHTLKGNCAIYGLETFAEVCHGIESALEDSGEPVSEAQRQSLLTSWRSLVARIGKLLGAPRREMIEVEPPELVELIARTTHGAPPREVAAVLTSWMHEPIARYFERLGTHAQGLARRLGKGELSVAIGDTGKIRIDAARWAPFWAAMVHAVRNAVDHGVEPSDVRIAAGKPAQGRLALGAERSPGRLAITIADDGGGIDWTAVRAKAVRLGLPAGTQDALVAALFADGVSTRDEATELSGRGVGLAALREVVVSLGGTIDVVSRTGGGTRFVSTFPFTDPELLAPGAHHSTTEAGR